MPLALASQAHEPTAPALEDDEEHDPTLPYDDAWPGPARPGFLERLRRGVLWSLAAVAAAAALTAYPVPALLVLLALTWFLRSASLAASATGDRRRVRGAKWYDPVIYLVGAPWHVVRAIAGTILLVLWSAGLALAAALICYAAATGLEATLFVSGLTFAVSLCLGPGRVAGQRTAGADRAPAVGRDRRVAGGRRRPPGRGGPARLPRDRRRGQLDAGRPAALDRMARPRPLSGVPRATLRRVHHPTTIIIC